MAVSSNDMRIEDPSYQRVRPELEVIAENLDLNGAQVLELGCGGAQMTRLVVDRFKVEALVATEVDAIQHHRNLRSDPVDRVHFRAGGAESIDADDAVFDAVLMFKSLHHVPAASMDQALAEIHRVLRPGGLAYLSEPVFAGEFNELLRLFHDEQKVRQAAFESVRRAVRRGLFACCKQVFFLQRNEFADFNDFEQRVLQVTHTELQLSPDTYAEVRSRFESRMDTAGAASFHQPIRVDLLQKPID